MIGGIGRSSAYFDAPEEEPETEDAFVRAALRPYLRRALPEGFGLADIADAARKQWRREHPPAEQEDE